MTEKDNNIRERIYTIVFQSDTRAGRLFDAVLLCLIILSILAVVLESVASIRASYLPHIRGAEWFFTVCFTVEYILRIYSSPKPAKYIFSFYGLIDLIAFLPSYIGVFYGEGHYLLVAGIQATPDIPGTEARQILSEGNILKTALHASRFKITVFITAVITLVTIVGTLMYLIEGEKSGFTSIPVSLYWAIVTITTVGYGDISPQTPLGQFLASLLMVIGYGIIAVPTGIVSVEIAKATENARENAPNANRPYTPAASFCANCGKQLHADNAGARQ